VAYYPAMDLLAQADLVISGGGYNTVHECLALNVPLVAIPWPRLYDPSGNVWNTVRPSVRTGFRSSNPAQS
jgi:hypothetical protein